MGHRFSSSIVNKANEIEDRMLLVTNPLTEKFKNITIELDESLKEKVIATFITIDTAVTKLKNIN